MKVVALRLFSVSISLVFTCLMLASVSYADVDLEKTIAMWLFDDKDEGDISEDSSDNGYDGTLMGDPEWKQGKFGKALQFDGENDYVDAGMVLFPPKDFTLCLWVYSEKSDGWGFLVESGIVEHGDTGGFRLELLSPNEGEYCLAVGDGGARSFTLKNIGWEYGKWFHLAFTYDGSMVRIYLDGAEVDSFGAAHDLSKGTGTLLLGSRARSQYYFKGLLDEVVIFSSVLEEDDIGSIMNGMESIRVVSSRGKLPTTWSSIRKH